MPATPRNHLRYRNCARAGHRGVGVRERRMRQDILRVEIKGLLEMSHSVVQPLERSEGHILLAPRELPKGLEIIGTIAADANALLGR